MYIAQDPVLFSGTMCYNLDPFDEYTDAELWAVLEQVSIIRAGGETGAWMHALLCCRFS